MKVFAVASARKEMRSRPNFPSLYCNRIVPKPPHSVLMVEPVLVRIWVRGRRHDEPYFARNLIRGHFEDTTVNNRNRWFPPQLRRERDRCQCAGRLTKNFVYAGRRDVFWHCSIPSVAVLIRNAHDDARQHCLESLLDA